MPSVVVAWKGNCRHSEVRYRLLSYLHRLAALSDEYLRMRQPERPFVLGVVNEQRGADFHPRPNIETVDLEIPGPVLVSSGIGPDSSLLLLRAREAGLPIVTMPDKGAAPLIELPRARLRGLDFKLFDPRGLYPGADRMSFVFLECPDHPFLDGRMVEVMSAEDCAASGVEALKHANALLSAPSIHLRYYLEDWTDCLFSWIRFFFIGDLWWHRREEMQGYDDYRGVFEEVQTDRGGRPAEAATFDAVLATFRQHAEHWTDEVQGWAASERG